LPHWDEDSAPLRRSLQKVSATIERDAAKRVLPTVAAAKRWQAQIMVGLAVDKPEYVGRFRGERGLERCGVQVGDAHGSAPWEVAGELQAFESTLQRVVAGLDASYPDADSLDEDGQSAAIELAAWAHAQWVRIHPFGNGNGRTARLWANLILMRYGLPPAIALRPRPGGGYAAAGAAAMRGQWRPTVDVFRALVREFFFNRDAAAQTKKKSKPPLAGRSKT
jgi:Fic/DOC family